MLSFPFCNRTTQLFPQQLYYYTPPDFISWSSSSPLPPSPPMLLAENQEYYYYTIYFALLMCSFVLQPKWRRGPRTQTYVSNIASSKTCRESTLLSREKDRKEKVVGKSQTISLSVLLSPCICCFYKDVWSESIFSLAYSSIDVCMSSWAEHCSVRASILFPIFPFSLFSFSLFPSHLFFAHTVKKEAEGKSVCMSCAF